MVKLAPKTFCGESQRNWSSPTIFIDLSSYSSGCVIPAHHHTNAYFCCALDGGCDERSGGRTESLDKGSLVFHPAGSEHSDSWTRDGRCLHIEFDAALYRGIDSQLTRSVSHPAGSRGRQLAREIYDEMRQTDKASALVFEGLTLLLLSETARAAAREPHAPNWLKTVRDRLLDEYLEPPALTAIAAEIGIHPTHVAYSFRQHFGSTAGELVRMRRVERASELLAQSDEPLAVIAALAGFSDQSHFCRAFKKSTGLSPLEYRRLSTKNPNPRQ